MSSTDNTTGGVITDDITGSVCVKEVKQKLQKFKYSNQSTDGVTKDQEADQDQYLNRYGSDFESIHSIHDQHQTEVDVFTQPDSMEGNYEEQWKKLLLDMKEEVKKEVRGAKEQLHKEMEQKVTDSVKLKVDEELKATKNNLKICQLQLNETIGTVVKQDQIIQECKSKIDLLQNKLDRN